MHILVVIVVTIPTSPRLSKTEFVGESYGVFLSEFLLVRKFKNREKERKKKGVCLAGLAGPEAGPRPGGSGGVPADFLPRGRPRPGRWPAASVARPASCAGRPA